MTEEVYQHLLSCMRLWKIQATPDGRFWEGPLELGTEVSYSHIKSLLRQELMIAFRLSEARRQKTIKALLEACVHKARESLH